MKKLQKILLFVAGGILFLSLSAALIVNLNFYWRAQKDYSVAPRDVKISYTAEALLHGEHLSVVKGCKECHGDDLGGKIMIEDPVVSLIAAPNITKGAGGLSADYTEVDFIKALRHGLRKDNKSLLIMPAHETSKLSDEDVAAIIAYCIKLPPVDRKMTETEFNIFGKALTTFGLIPAFSAEAVDHAYIQPKKVLREVSLKHGEYLAVSCSGCHKENFKGGPSPVPGLPPIPDITSTGRLGKWNKEHFKTVLKTGQLPDGRKIKNEDMPWKMTSHYTEEEIESLFLFLKSI